MPQDQLVSSIWAGGQAAAAAVLITRAAAASAQPVPRRLEPRSSRTEPAAMISVIAHHAVTWNLADE